MTKSTPEYKKELQKNPTASHGEILKLCIVDLLKVGYTIPQIAGKLNLKLNALSYHLSSLKRIGIITQKGYGTWEIIREFEPKEVQKMTHQRSSKTRGVEVVDAAAKAKEDDTRGHGFVIRFFIRKNLKNWQNRGDILKEHFPHLQPEPLGLYGWKIMFKGHPVHLWDTKIVIHSSDSFISRKAWDTKSTAIDYFISIIRKLEGIFNSPGEFKYRRYYTFKFSRQHYALMRNAMARQFNAKGEKIKIANAYGVFMLIDDSFHLDEAEFIQNRNPDKNDAVKNAEGAQVFFEQMKGHDWKVTPQFILDSMHGIQENQKVFDKNMMSHLGVLGKIGDGVVSLSSVVENIQRSLSKIHGLRNRKLTEFTPKNPAANKKLGEF